jgi:hypothetical protein
MAYIKLIGKRDTDPEEGVNERILTDDTYNRVAYWAAKKFYPNGVPVPAELDADGNVITEASVRPPTGAEVFTALTDNVYEEITRECEAWYLVQAEAAARESVAPIELTVPVGP